MATVVGVMDRDEWSANTDNLVVVEPERRRLLWVPRDLWCPALGDRINTAWARGGHAALVAALAEHGIEAQHSLCLRRAAAQAALVDVEVAVPVDRPLDLAYPLSPTARIQAGHTIVSFRPPEERLAGVRVHQWLGARYGLRDEGGDLARIARQQTFVRCALAAGVDPSAALADPALVRASSPAALADLEQIAPTWAMETLGGLRPARRDGREVLLRGRPGRLAAWLSDGASGRRLSRSLPWRAAPRVRAAIAALLRTVRGAAVTALVVPSTGLGDPGRRVRLVALLAVRDEAQLLPGLLANVAPQVDGIVALDDGSTDGSGDLLAACPAVLEVIRVPRGREAWDEVGNFRRLHTAALRHGAEWILSIDADERLESGFRRRAERVIRRGRALGLRAFALRLRELWDSPDCYRADGPWGRKRVARLFAALPDHRFDFRPLHGMKAPLQARVAGRFVAADLVLYHLRMIRAEDRAARRRRYEALDPDACWQPGLGYAYLTDESGLVLRRVPRRRAWVHADAPAAGTELLSSAVPVTALVAGGSPAQTGPDRTASPAPVASVIVLAYDAAAVIRRALESLRRQTFAEPYEVIVVWSGDRAAAGIARAELPQAVLVGREERLMTGAARNLGVAHARGDIIAFLAADCEAAPDWLERRVAAHREGHGAVGGAVLWAEPATASARASHLLEYNACPPGRPRAVVDTPLYNLSFRRALLDRCGRWEDSLPCGEDCALVWALVGAGERFLFDPTIRIFHPGNRTLGELWRHQEWHGYWFGRLGGRGRVPGFGGAELRRNLRLVALYPAGRLWRMGRRLLLWQPAWALQAVPLLPWLLIGLAAATVGVVRGLRVKEPASS